MIIYPVELLFLSERRPFPHVQCSWGKHEPWSHASWMVELEPTYLQYLPMVNVNSWLWKITMFNGKIHELNGHFQ